MQGEPPDPAARPRRTRRPGRHPVRLRHHRQPPRLLLDPGLPPERSVPVPTTKGHDDPSTTGDLLDGVADWGPTLCHVGIFHLIPVTFDRGIPLVARWMNDPVVAAFWDLAGPEIRTTRHIRVQLQGGGRSVPCLGVLNGTPMSYWEIYRADLDPLARYYPALPHDTGLHLLIGDARDRGRGLGGVLLRTVADLILEKRPDCPRVIAEPDVRNAPSLRIFYTSGFECIGEVDLPSKRAVLVTRDRDSLCPPPEGRLPQFTDPNLPGFS
ncbi:GNAT family N-acetyltransferase [Streptomyces acidiscabies]|uniref:GNAT family N-acetyltransferase n=1 Tax=Streptomyces acidiscabies TaxID=42234 RepID=UPI001F292C6F|nr:GNAT family N-acetyltransferase [Streptomyces acidiscabies]